MDAALFEHHLREWHQLLPTLNDPLKKWGQQPVDISDPKWMEKLQQRKTPLETDPQLRQRFDATTREIAEIYCLGNEEQRDRIRSLLRQMSGVRQFMGIASSTIRVPDDEATFRLALLFESLADSREDTRDVILNLDDLCKAGRQAGIDVNRYLKEIGALSSDTDHYGMGSMKHLLLSRMT